MELDDIENRGAFQLETLNGDDNALFSFGQSVYDAQGDPIGASYGIAGSDGVIGLVGYGL